MELNISFLTGVGCGLCLGLWLFALKKYFTACPKTAKALLKYNSAEALKLVTVRTDINMSKKLEDIPSSFTSIPSPESDTMDVVCKPCPQIDFSVTPFTPRGPPERNTYAGDLNFAVEVNSKDVHKTFLYSHQLCRIYVDMKCNFSIQFNWNYVKAPHMFVRATVVFSDETQAEKRVERCVQHVHESAKAGIQREIAKNVLHSSREIGTQGVYYCGNVNVADSWYSVLVEFTRNSPEPCSHAYQFSCKNSCATRRAIAVIFTLEDDAGRVYGRQKVGARVCACPKRDMLKDEAAEGVYKLGIFKVENLMEFDDTVFKLPPLQIVGSRATLCGLKMILKTMEMALECRKNNPEPAGLYEKPIADLKEAIKKMEKTRITSQ